MRRTEFVVDWPVQGVATFRSHASELVLSDIYWMWILEALRTRATQPPLAFVEAWDGAFQEASTYVERLPVTPALLEALRQVTPPPQLSFALLRPTTGCTVPTPAQLVGELERVVAEAVSTGSIEIELD